jgi:hypothetical protein
MSKPAPWCESAEIGPHRLLAGDLANNAIVQLMGNERADALYCDPPWGPGNLKYWHTHAKIEAPQISWEEFVKIVDNVLRLHVKPLAPVWIEMGLRWVARFTECLFESGRSNPFVWITRYGSSELRPCALIYSGPSLPDGFDPSYLRGAKLPHACLQACRLEQGAVVLDPCCGKGYTARATHTLGLSFRGLELNPHRLGYTEQWLRKNQS